MLQHALDVIVMLNPPDVLVINLTVICTAHPVGFLNVFCVADVPDAPKNVEISELQSPRNICLSWVPGSDHNSSVTGGH